MTIHKPPVTTLPWFAAIPDLLCIHLCLFALKTWRQCVNNSPESGTCAHMWSSLSVICFVGGQFAIFIHQIINLSRSPRRKPIRQTRHKGTPFCGWGCALGRAGVSRGMRASPSTCRVLTIDWHVRGLYPCFWQPSDSVCATVLTVTLSQKTNRASHGFLTQSQTKNRASHDFLVGLSTKNLRIIWKQGNKTNVVDLTMRTLATHTNTDRQTDRQTNTHTRCTCVCVC